MFYASICCAAAIASAAFTAAGPAVSIGGGRGPSGSRKSGRSTTTFIYAIVDFNCIEATLIESIRVSNESASFSKVAIRDDVVAGVGLGMCIATGATICGRRAGPQ